MHRILGWSQELTQNIERSWLAFSTPEVGIKLIGTSGKKILVVVPTAHSVKRKRTKLPVSTFEEDISTRTPISPLHSQFTQNVEQLANNS